MRIAIKKLILAVWAVAACSICQAQDNTTKGTDQINGAVGKFGEVYTVSDSGTLFNIAVTGAEYSVMPFLIRAGDQQTVNSDQKLLVIHYRVKNPDSKSDLSLSSWHIFQAVDANSNLLNDSGYSRRDSEMKALDQVLKPGQGVDDITTFIVVPAQGPIPKPILNRPLATSNSKLIRYDLQSKLNPVKGLQPPYLDSSDASGATPLASLPATTGSVYTGGFLSFSVDSIALVPSPLGSYDAGDGKQYLVVKITFTNPTWSTVSYGADWFKVALKTEDDKIEDIDVIKASENDQYSGRPLDPADSQAQRVLLKVGKDAKLKTLTVQINYGDGLSRAYTYDVSHISMPGSL